MELNPRFLRNLRAAATFGIDQVMEKADFRRRGEQLNDRRDVWCRPPPGTELGRFSQELMCKAKPRVIGMRNDEKTIFPETA